ncbi:hypothetical protein F4604DRAFT_496475 [Suillus subluteus]|nr:hypothetical protein F4604DRAFT_496475 [Suillus subluteus]
MVRALAFKATRRGLASLIFISSDNADCLLLLCSFAVGHRSITEKLPCQVVCSTSLRLLMFTWAIIMHRRKMSRWTDLVESVGTPSR